MALAFLILAHKNPEQVARLFRTIYRPEDTIVLHFDRRSDASLHRLGEELAQQNANVILMRPRTIVVAGFAATEVQLTGMAGALAANGRWHHFINISGQDFPLKSMEQLEARLLAEPDVNYVPWFDPLANSLWRNARTRIERHYLDWVWLDRLLKARGLGRGLRNLFSWQNKLPFVPLVKRKLPDFHYYGGSNYVVLSRAACEYATSDPNALRISRWMKHSMHSDEILIQTIMMNSPLAHTVVNTNLHEIDFQKDSPHPKTFSSADLELLLASPKYFARKFDSARDPGLLESLAEHLS